MEERCECYVPLFFTVYEGCRDAVPSEGQVVRCGKDVSIHVPVNKWTTNHYLSGKCGTDGCNNKDLEDCETLCNTEDL